MDSKTATVVLGSLRSFDSFINNRWCLVGLLRFVLLQLIYRICLDMLGFEDLVLDFLFKLLAGDEIHPVETYTYSLN